MLWNDRYLETWRQTGLSVLCVILCSIRAAQHSPPTAASPSLSHLWPSSLHGTLCPLFLPLPLYRSYLCSLSAPVSHSLPSCHPVHHLFLPLTLPGSRQQCLSLLKLSVAAPQEADLTLRLCCIHQLACRAGMPADTTHSLSLYFITFRRPLSRKHRESKCNRKREK